MSRDMWSSQRCAWCHVDDGHRDGCKVLRAEQDAEDDRNRAVRAAQKGEHDTEPPVDEDALAEARAYERGRADATRDAAEWLRKAGRGLAAWHIEQKERDRLAVKRETAKS